MRGSISSLAFLLMIGGVQPGQAAASVGAGATLTVNDADGLGRVGDKRLSLAEAIRLANGSLTLTQLSKAERRQVRGSPGPAAADLIRFSVRGDAVRLPVQILAKPDQPFAPLIVNSLMPILRDNDGDTIGGRGVRLTNGADDMRDTVNAVPLFKGAPIGGLGLIVESANVTIKDVAFERFATPLSFRSADGKKVLSGMRVTGNKFHNGGGITFSAVTAAGERGTLRDLVISDNDFRGPRQFGEEFPSMLHSAMSIVGVDNGVKDTSASAPDGVVEDVTIARNSVKDFAGGVHVMPLQTVFAPNRGARLSRLTVAGNDIALLDEATDPAIYLWGAVAVNGHASDVSVSDVLVEGNKVVGNGFIVFIAGVEALMGGEQPPRNIHMQGIRVRGNQISPRKSCSVGIATIGGFPEMNGPPVTEISVSDVEVSGNTVAGCATGLLASPVVNVGAPGKSTGNMVRGIKYDGNTITGAKTGILVAGGALIAAGEVSGSADIVRNHVHDVQVMRNSIDAKQAGILIAGGYVASKVKGHVTDNEVQITRIADNKGTGTTPLCRVADQFTDGAAQAEVHGNHVIAQGTSCGR